MGPRDFRLHPAQEQFLESGGRMMLIGKDRGRRALIESAIWANACSAEEAQLCIDDLNTTGIALQTASGKRVDPKPEPRGEDPRFTYMRFDEGYRTVPCPDCDGAACEHCGDGRRRV